MYACHDLHRRTYGQRAQGGETRAAGTAGGIGTHMAQLVQLLTKRFVAATSQQDQCVATFKVSQGIGGLSCKTFLQFICACKRKQSVVRLAWRCRCRILHAAHTFTAPCRRCPDSSQPLASRGPSPPRTLS